MTKFGDITGGVKVQFEPQKLDGSATHKDFVTPFDAHDKVVRDSSDYKHQEYPKAIDHEQKPDAPEGHFEPIIANGPAEEGEE